MGDRPRDGMTPRRRVGVDTGGTFTDAVDGRGTIDKVPSIAGDPARAVAAILARAGGADVLTHGTTVPTNALLERRGGRIALVATEGHADVIEIARQVRPSLYDPWLDRPEPLVPRELRFEVAGRLDGDGRQLSAPGDVELPAGIETAAVCLLHADRNPAHERHVATALRRAGLDVTVSSEVSPEFREYERTVTTVANAYLRTPCRAYLLELAGLAADVLVMTSAGGLIPVGEAADQPVALLLSGPAGGVLAACAAATAAGFPDAVTFDMGGTSTDVCLIRDGRPQPAAQRTVAGFPIRMPSLDVHTIGAGGGSVAGIDAGGALVVGPASAGADPGPVCYGRGGDQATVTDADLLAGRIPADGGLPGLDRLDVRTAQRVLDRAGLTAAGIIDVVDANMVRAVRRVSVERGVDPRGLALVAFGGAGPLHACALADALGMSAVVVPARAGVLSAAGILTGPRQVDVVRSSTDPKDLTGAERALAELAVETGNRLSVEGEDPTVETALDCRYAGQSHELTVATVADFEAEHRRRNGFARPGAPIEVVALRASARLRSPVSLMDLPDPGGRAGPRRGPAVIAEPDCTIWVPQGWTADVGGGGAWVLTRRIG
ncbi:MAG TPA: hydantoinase/oxoprolinase family protein [Acidimicrobiales bacterium]|nr:hydantoinase/oxoprolinase family protein [Acidimicrobiales bacterium]